MALPGVNSTLARYWGIINSTATGKLTTTAVWEEIRAFEAAQGISRPAGLLRAVNAMRSLAVSQRVARERLTKAGPGEVLTSAHIAQDFNSRPQAEQNLAPSHQVRFKATVLTGEGQIDRWLAIVVGGVLPATKGDLTRLIAIEALGFSTGYGHVLVGLTGDIEITAV